VLFLCLRTFSKNTDGTLVWFCFLCFIRRLCVLSYSHTSTVIMALIENTSDFLDFLRPDKLIASILDVNPTVEIPIPIQIYSKTLPPKKWVDSLKHRVEVRRHIVLKIAEIVKVGHITAELTFQSKRGTSRKHNQNNYAAAPGARAGASSSSASDVKVPEPGAATDTAAVETDSFSQRHGVYVVKSKHMGPKYCHDWYSFGEAFTHALLAEAVRADGKSLNDSSAQALKEGVQSVYFGYEKLAFQAFMSRCERWDFGGHRLFYWYHRWLGATTNKQLQIDLANACIEANKIKDYILFVYMVERIQQLYPRRYGRSALSESKDVSSTSSSGDVEMPGHGTSSLPHCPYPKIPLYNSSSCDPEDHVATIHFHPAGKSTPLPFIVSESDGRMYTSLSVAAIAHSVGIHKVSKPQFRKFFHIIASDLPVVDENNEETGSDTDDDDESDGESESDAPPLDVSSLGQFLNQKDAKRLETLQERVQECTSDLLGDATGEDPRALLTALQTSIKELSSIEKGLGNQRGNLAKFSQDAQDFLPGQRPTTVVFIGECGTGKSTTAGKWVLSDEHLESDLGAQLLSRKPPSGSPTALGTFVPIKLSHSDTYELHVHCYDEEVTLGNLSAHLLPALAHEPQAYEIVDLHSQQGWCDERRNPTSRSAMFASDSLSQQQVRAHAADLESSQDDCYDTTPILRQQDSRSSFDGKTNADIPIPILLGATKDKRVEWGQGPMVFADSTGLVDSIHGILATLYHNQALFMGCKYIEVRAPEFRKDAVFFDTPGLKEHEFITFRIRGIMHEADVVAFTMAMTSVRAFKAKNSLPLWEHGFYDDLICRPNDYIENLRYLMPICGGLNRGTVEEFNIKAVLENAEEETRFSLPSSAALQRMADVSTISTVVDAARPKLREFFHFAHFYGMEHDTARPHLQRAIDRSSMYRFLGKLELARGMLDRRIRFLQTRLRSIHGSEEAKLKKKLRRQIKKVSPLLQAYKFEWPGNESIGGPIVERVDNTGGLVRRIISETLGRASTTSNVRRLIISTVAPSISQVILRVMKHLCLIDQDAVEYALRDSLNGISLEEFIAANNTLAGNDGERTLMTVDEICDVTTAAVASECEKAWREAEYALKNGTRSLQNTIYTLRMELVLEMLPEFDDYDGANELQYSVCLERAADIAVNLVRRALISFIKVHHQPSLIGRTTHRVINCIIDHVKSVSNQLRNKGNVSANLRNVYAKCHILRTTVRGLSDYDFVFSASPELTVQSGFDSLLFDPGCRRDAKNDAAQNSSNPPRNSSNLMMRLDFVDGCAGIPDAKMSVYELEAKRRTIVFHRSNSVAHGGMPSFHARVPRQLVAHLLLTADSHPIFHCYEAHKVVYGVKKKTMGGAYAELPSYQQSQLVFYVAPHVPSLQHDSHSRMFDNMLAGVCKQVQQNESQNGGDGEEEVTNNVPWFIRVYGQDDVDCGIASQHVMWNLCLMFVKAMQQLTRRQFEEALVQNPAVARSKVRSQFRMFTIVDGAFGNAFHEWRYSAFKQCPISRAVQRLYQILRERSASNVRGRNNIAQELTAILTASAKVLDKQLQKSLKSAEWYTTSTPAATAGIEAMGKLVEIFCTDSTKVFSKSKGRKVARRVRSYLSEHYADDLKSLSGCDHLQDAIYVENNHDYIGRLLQRLLGKSDSAGSNGAESKLQLLESFSQPPPPRLVRALSVAQESQFNFDPLHDDDSSSDDDSSDSEQRARSAPISLSDSTSPTAVWLVDLSALTSALRKQASSLQLQSAMVSVSTLRVHARRFHLQQDSASRITHNYVNSPKRTGALCILTEAMGGMALYPDSVMKAVYKTATDAYAAFCDWEDLAWHGNKQWSAALWRETFGAKERYGALEYYYKNSYTMKVRGTVGKKTSAGNKQSANSLVQMSITESLSGNKRRQASGSGPASVSATSIARSTPSRANGSTGRKKIKVPRKVGEKSPEPVVEKSKMSNKSKSKSKSKSKRKSQSQTLEKLNTIAADDVIMADHKIHNRSFTPSQSRSSVDVIMVDGSAPHSSSKVSDHATPVRTPPSASATGRSRPSASAAAAGRSHRISELSSLESPETEPDYDNFPVVVSDPPQKRTKLSATTTATKHKKKHKKKRKS
jgi:hypothetical protein